MLLGWVFKKVIGIEASPILAKKCRENIRQVNAANEKIELVEADVIKTGVPEDTNVVFMFNPLDDKGMKALAERLPQQAEVIYVNPIRSHFLYEQGFERKGFLDSPNSNYQVEILER
jgi:tRNA A58 N-methylase Trm61